MPSSASRYFPVRPNAARRCALALTVLTGFTALVYEVAWQKYLATLLGSHAEATAAVLAIFLGGLAAGYALFGALTRRLVARAARTGTAPRLLAYYGALEAGIGLYAVLFPVLFTLVQNLSFVVPHATGGLGFAFDVVLAALLVAPPAVLMGGTIPFLSQALARDLEDATRIHAFVYAFNTFGAFAGALAGGFWLVPGLGLVNVMIAMGVLNLLVGVTYRALDPLAPGAAVPPAQAHSAMPPVRGYAGYAAVALLTGFAMITVQTVVMRLGALSFGSSEFTFAMVVAVFVLCIALGSFAVSAVSRIPPWALIANQWLLALLLVWLYHRLPDGPYLAHRLRMLFTTRPEAFYLYQLGAFIGVLALLAGPVLLSGASLPLLFNQLRRQLGDLGGVAGRLYSWNTVGSFLGALAGGYALLFWTDLDVVFRVAIVAIGLSAILLGLLHASRRALLVTALVAVPVVALVAALDSWSPRRLSPGLFRAWHPLPYTGEPEEQFLKQWWADIKLLFYDDDPTLSVLVTESSSNSQVVRSILVNGKSDSATHGDTPTTVLAAVLPALFAEKVERAFVVGFGTGVTAGELAFFASTKEVIVAEISPAVVRAAPLFDFANHDASKNPKLKFVRSDAYRALLRSEGQFDVIASEPSNPWVTGVEMLYSREFLAAARSRLAPGGVFVQWIHQYATSDEVIELVLRTYAEVFDHVAVWHGLGTDLQLLGFENAQTALDLERLERRAQQPEFVAALARAEVPSFPALLAHEVLPLDVLHAMQLSGPVHTLLRPRLSHIAGRAYFEGESGDLPFSGAAEPARVGSENSFLGRYFARDPMRIGDARAQVVSEACRHRISLCAALLAQWYASEGGGPAFQQAATQARAASNRAFGGPLNPASVAQLASTFISDEALPATTTPAAAQRATNLLRAYYQHSVPMRTERLITLWERCTPREDEPEACAAGLAEARSLLGVAASESTPTATPTAPQQAVQGGVRSPH